MHGELTLEELMHFVLDCGLEWTFTTRENGKDEKLRVPLVHKKPRRQVIDLIFMGRLTRACSHIQGPGYFVLTAECWGEHAAALCHGLLRKNKGRCKTKLWIGTVALCFELADFSSVGLHDSAALFFKWSLYGAPGNI